MAVSAILIVLCTRIAGAQDTEAGAACGDLLEVVDRPSFGVNPCTVPAGGFLIESGYVNVRGGDSGVTYPQTELRFGTTPRLDVTLSLPSANLTPDAASFDVIGAGFKYRLVTGTFQIATFASYEVPVGTSGTVNLVSGIAGSRDFGKRWGGEVTVAYDVHGRSLIGAAELSVHLGEFAEGFVEVARTALGGGAPAVVFDFGVQARITRDLALDFEVGRTVSPFASRQTFVGFGAAFGRLRSGG